MSITFLYTEMSDYKTWEIHDIDLTYRVGFVESILIRVRVCVVIK